MRRRIVLFLSIAVCLVTLGAKKRDSWRAIQEQANNAVVQVVAQVGQFDWLQPYKTRTQKVFQGSGFFINGNGYVITNAHVIDEAKRVWIHIPALGKKNIHMDIVSVAPGRDLALLRIKQESLREVKKVLGDIPWLPLGDSDSVRRTDEVLAIGYPLGEPHLKSATGIVSGRMYDEQSYIQITAPINSGNSGGPLLNAKGEVIGINTAAVPSAENIGYSIPVNMLKIIQDDLWCKKFIRKPFFGIKFNRTSDFHAQFLGNPTPGGLYINKVFKGSLADRAGIEAGDMLYTFNGYTLDVYGDANVSWSADKVSIHDLIARLQMDQKLPLVLYRNGKRKEVEVVFEQTDVYPIRTMYPDYEKISYEVIGGMVVMQLTDNHLALLKDASPYLVNYQKTENKLDPVLVVTHVLPGSLVKQRANLFAGDIVREINGVKVKTLEAFRKALHLGITTDSLEIKTDEDVSVVLPLKKTVDDEKRLSEYFGYPISPTVQQLVGAMQKK